MICVYRCFSVVYFDVLFKLNIELLLFYPVPNPQQDANRVKKI